jgi:hypothetical protein
MKKQNENGRIPEDRLSRANKRKKNNTIASILVMTGCLLVLVLVTYVAGILYSWIDSKFQNNANDLAAAAEAGSQTEESTQEVVKTPVLSMHRSSTNLQVYLRPFRRLFQFLHKFHCLIYYSSIPLPDLFHHTGLHMFLQDCIAKGL